MTLDIISPLNAYGGLFLSAFLAATLLPASSEPVLAALLGLGAQPWVILLAVATLGNTLGALANWALGRWCARFEGRRWFPLTPAGAARARAWFRRWGTWSLLFSWLPVVGDPLTVVAGMLRTHPARFLLLVAAGKAARYGVVAAAVAGLWPGG
jgi:membrane protein YqaA with SNARE-associated domain